MEEGEDLKYKEDWNRATLYNTAHTMNGAANRLERWFGNKQIVKDLRRGAKVVKSAAKLIRERID